jgi:hypothetical protein
MVSYQDVSGGQAVPELIFGAFLTLAKPSRGVSGSTGFREDVPRMGGRDSTPGRIQGMHVPRYARGVCVDALTPAEEIKAVADEFHFYGNLIPNILDKFATTDK